MCLKYINDNYWGLYNLREKVSENFIASKHDVDADDARGGGFAFVVDGAEVFTVDRAAGVFFDFALDPGLGVGGTRGLIAHGMGRSNKITDALDCKTGM